MDTSNPGFEVLNRHILSEKEPRFGKWVRPTKTKTRLGCARAPPTERITRIRTLRVQGYLVLPLGPP